VAGLGGGFPAVDRDQLFPHLLRHPLRLEQEVRKSEVAYLPASELMHGFDVQGLKGQQIEPQHEHAGLLPLPIVADVGNLFVGSRPTPSSTRALEDKLPYRSDARR
jgi:hypothetical protein